MSSPRWRATSKASATKSIEIVPFSIVACRLQAGRGGKSVPAYFEGF
jgi:hypothetical protein